jgi:hypothetical protein
MTAPILAAATFCIAATAIHVASIVVAILRFRGSALGEAPSARKFPRVSLVRPLCGIDNYGHLEKFLSPSRRKSDSMTASGHRRMERAGHGAEGLF